MESEFYVMLPSNSSTKLPRTLQLDGEWEVGLVKIDYPHTWYNIREGKNSVEIYVPDRWLQEISIQPGSYEKVQDVIDAMLKARLANTTDVVVTHDDTSKRVTLRCTKGPVLELTLRKQQLERLTKKVSPFPYPKLEINIFMFIPIPSRASIMVMLLFPFFILLQ